MPWALAAVSVGAVVGTLFAATPASAALADGRAYELVSASGAGGEPYKLGGMSTEGLLRTEMPFQAAANGTAITYVGEPSTTTGGEGKTGQQEGEQWFAVRASYGWQTNSITPVNPKSNNERSFYQAFSPDLTTAVMRGANAPLAPTVPEKCQALYTRAAQTGAFTALLTPNEAPVPTDECGRPIFAGASTEGTHVIFQSEAALTSNAKAATEPPPTREQTEGPTNAGCVFGCNLYESTGGHLLPVNVIGGHTVPSAVFGGYPGPKVNEEDPGLPDFSNAISADGSRIFWTDTQPETEDFGHVYVLENESSTVQVSGAQPAVYWAATPDGRYAYYTEAGQLWQFDTTTNTRTSITPAASGVTGVIGVNQTGEEGASTRPGEDGGYLYFVAEAALAPGATYKTCVSYSEQREQLRREKEAGHISQEERERAAKAASEEGEAERNGHSVSKTGCNLYVRHAGETRFIATLAPEDNERTAHETPPTGGAWKPDLGDRTAELTPDGRHLVFESQRPLTAYPNTYLNPNPKLTDEAFVYDASPERVICASCDPTGAPTPLNFHEPEGANRLPVSSASRTYMHRWISDDGNRVFFDSTQALLPQDVNEVQDVYEWEREGTPGCPHPTSVFGGCVFLLTDGHALAPSFLVDADNTGDNVFFEYPGSLGGAETAPGQNELYDARVGGGFATPSVACSGTACAGEVQHPPSFETPASSTFPGGGNLLPPTPAAPDNGPPKPTHAELLRKALKICHSKRDKRRRARCERQARNRFGAHARQVSKSRHGHHLGSDR